MKGLIIDVDAAPDDAQIVAKLINATDVQMELINVRELEQAKQMIGHAYPDLVFIFLDAQLSLGLKVTRYLAANMSRVKIIWISQKKEYALMAFEEHVWHFLKMPLDDEAVGAFKKRLLSA